MPTAKNPISEEERLKRFKAEVRRQSEGGGFDRDAADAAVEALVRKKGDSLEKP